MDDQIHFAPVGGPIRRSPAGRGETIAPADFADVTIDVGEVFV
jgi:hypothetical protein